LDSGLWGRPCSLPFPSSLSLLWSIYSAQRFNKLPFSPPPLSCSLAAEVTDFVRQVRCSSHRFPWFCVKHDDDDDEGEEEEEEEQRKKK